MFHPSTTFGRILLAIAIGIITGVVVYILGQLIAVVPNLVNVGNLVSHFAWLFGAAAGVIYYFTGKTI